MIVVASPLPVDADVFAIDGVAVDETAADTRQARANALDSALHIAWRDLARRLVRGDPGAVLNQDTATLDGLVQGLEFNDERMSPGRYQAVVSVRFQAQGVLDILDEAGVGHLDTPGPVLVVLPVLQTDTQRLLWQESNLWLAAWQRSPAGRRAVELIVPGGGLRDIGLVDVVGALAHDWDQLERLVRHYRADGVLLAYARRQGTTLRPRLTWIDENGASPVLLGRNVPEAWPTEAVGRAVDEIRTGIDDHWGAMALAPAGPTLSVLADIPVAGLAEWIDTRDRLESSPALQAIIPLLVSTTRVRVRLLFTGTRDNLVLHMRRAGLDVEGRVGSLTIRPQ